LLILTSVSVGGDTYVYFCGSGFVNSVHTGSDVEVAIIACHIGGHTVLKEEVTADRSKSVGNLSILLPTTLRRC
jgi:hypothetical protein